MSGHASKYQIGDLIDNRYRVVKLLGAGGMAEVYLVEDSEMHNRKIALKLLFPHISIDQVNVERFIREVEITQRHNHPNIVKSYHYGKTPRNEQYFTMEYVEGRSLADVIKEKGKIPFKEVFKYLIQTLEGLSVAHKLGVIHRDIKPENIMLTNDNVIKLSDFGIAKDITTDIKLTDLDKAPKSYLYKAPELYIEAYDHRVDIYALGIATYEMLTGTTPFTGERNQLLVAHLNKPIPKFISKENEIPAFFENFVETAAEKKPENRFKSAKEALDFLKSHAGELSGFASTKLGRYANRSLLYRKARKFVTPIFAKYGIALLLGLLNVSLYVPLIHPSIVIGDAMDLALMDRFFKVRGPIPPPNDIKIIAVDEESYEAKKVSVLRPWPRAMHAELLERLALDKPRLVIFDYRFPKNEDGEIADLTTDQRLANAMKNLPVYISHFVNIKDGKQVWLENDPLFEKSAKGLFFANLVDPGVVRNFNTYTEDRIPPIAKVLYGPKIHDAELPNREALINYYGPSRTFNVISYHRAMSANGDFPMGYFKDKIIFVGQVLALGYQIGQRDTFMTPFGSTGGVEIHATSLANIAKENWINRMQEIDEAMLIFLASIFLAYIFLKIKQIFLLYIMFAGMVSVIIISYSCFKSMFFLPIALLAFPLMPLIYLISLLKVHLENKRVSQILGV